jgi:beta-N-acetylhexosaminidase
MRRFLRLTFAIILFALPAPLRPVEQPAEQGTSPEVEAILQQMTPQERVGQLFLVTFQGTDHGPDSDIARLIQEYGVGGVVLREDNNNLTGEGDALIREVYILTSDLQRLAAEQPVSGVPEEALGTPVTQTATPQGPFVPLFVGIEHEGSGWPYLHLLSGVTPLPSNMAVGATWDPTYAETMGQITGQELSALGINLLLGPPVDVLDTPRPFATGDLGTRVFGGEPFWVSQMAAAYVRGAHTGSQGRLAVVPRHFPGYGGADRLASVEIPAVRRSRDQLTQFDLQPFFAVTGDAENPAEVADGLLVGHIRYQGFYADNLRAYTKPITFDQVALQSLLGLESIASWRAEGGLVISDSLGLRGVRRYYDPQEVLFPSRRIALDAFGAGNDILYLGNFGPAEDQTDAIIDVLDFFVQRYESEAPFQAQVDAAVRRIIAKKLALYGTFDIDTVVPPEAGLDAVGGGQETTFETARAALTLLEPAQPDLLDAPQRDDQMVIFTDTRTARQCATCDEQPLIAVDALQSAIMRSYGPAATGVVSLADVSSFSFAELEEYIRVGPQLPPTPEEEETPAPDLLGVALDNADWVVFMMLDSDADIPGSNVVRSFLADPPVSPDTRIVVMAMGAPYYLDSTEVSKLTAYYALYGYTEPFIDVAARALFQELAPAGAAPVSVPAVDYLILEVTSPDPVQIIELSYSVDNGEAGADTTPTVEPIPEQGDTILLTTDVIVDYNGNPVPDGTPVEFLQNYVNEGVRTTQTVTQDGIAQANIVVEGPGELRITAVSGQARNSETVQLVVSDTGTRIEVLPPDVTPTAVAPTPTPQTPEPSPTAAAIPTLVPTPVATEAPDVPSVDFGDLFLALIGLIGIGVAAFVFGLTTHDLNYGLLLALPSLAFGLLGYNYYALLLPGMMTWRNLVGEGWAAGLAAWLGGLIGLGLVNAAIYAWNRWVVIALRNRQRG